MRTYKQKLDSLDKSSCWVFTKQDTDFDQAFKAVKLFSEIPDKESINIERYFEENHSRYGVNTDRHRMLVIPQMYGLLTKTPFYVRGGNYSAENPTEVFDLNKALDSQSVAYHIFKTEQLLKIKIHAIIDTAKNNKDYCVLPIVFIYKVLKELKNKHGKDSVSIDHLYTYIMTCKHCSEWEEAVYFISTDAPVSDYVAEYKSRSRVITFIKNNVCLFNISGNEISINSEFDEYFENLFMKKYDFEDLHEQLVRDVDYAYFLHNSQNFNINLIDIPQNDIPELLPVQSTVSSYIDELDDETEYIARVDRIDEHNINIDAGEDAYKTAPVEVTAFDKKRRFRTNPLLGKIAIKKAYYQCERMHTHCTFTSKKTGKPYMEAHHLLPVCYQKDMWEKYNVNIDCLENLVSLCPTCHRAFHYGTDEVKKAFVEDLYNKVLPKYHAIGLNISLNEMMALYKIH